MQHSASASIPRPRYPALSSWLLPATLSKFNQKLSFLRKCSHKGHRKQVAQQLVPILIYIAITGCKRRGVLTCLSQYHSPTALPRRKAIPLACGFHKLCLLSLRGIGKKTASRFNSSVPMSGWIRTYAPTILSTSVANFRKALRNDRFHYYQDELKRTLC